MFTIVTSNIFLRRARKFLKKHPDLKGRFAEVLENLRQDPFRSELELHNLSGKLKGCQAVSLTHRYRITLTFVIAEKEIILLDIGSHDEVYS